MILEWEYVQSYVLISTKITRAEQVLFFRRLSGLKLSFEQFGGIFVLALLCVAVVFIFTFYHHVLAVDSTFTNIDDDRIRNQKKEEWKLDVFIAV